MAPNGRRLSPFRSAIVPLFRIVDVLLVAGLLRLIAAMSNVEWTDIYTLAVAWGVALFMLFSEFQGVYHSWHGAPVRQESFRIFFTWIFVVLGLLFVGYATKTSAEYSRRVILTWFVLTPIVLAIWRTLMHFAVGLMHKYGFNTRRVAIVGARDLGAHLARSMLHSPWMGLRPIGFYDDRKPAGLRPLAAEPLHVAGNLDVLVTEARKGAFDIIYITLPMRAEERIKKLIANLSDTTASVYLVPDFFMFDLLSAKWGNVGDLPVVSIFDTPFYGVDGWLKRVLDVALGSLILAIIAIPMLVIAAGIKLTSRGPVLFKQRRYGFNGNTIDVWKFRTMAVCENGSEVVQAKKNDPRVTRIGAFLRRTSLDELPQFFNVLQGTMSIVGPRPHAVAHNEEYRKLINGYMLRHKVKPGITGLAQVNGWRGETDALEKMQKRIEHDLGYISNWSLGLDLKIILLTIFKGFKGRNAY